MRAFRIPAALLVVASLALLGCGDLATAPSLDELGPQFVMCGNSCPPTLVVVITVTIDIKPGSDPNCIKATSRGTIPVAILSSASFDAADVDANTVELEGVGPPVRSSANKDVDDDGLKDLVLHFSTVALNGASKLTDGNTLDITGELFDGTPIQGSDVIFLAGGPTCQD